MNKLGIDTSFDFTTDSPGYWDNFWENKDGIGAGNCDPDVVSPTLQSYHSQLWSKKLPNGETLELVPGSGANYLTWKEFRFVSDSIITSFLYKRYITDVNPGCGLIKVGSSLVPFENKFPRNTELYKLMTTKPG